MGIGTPRTIASSFYTRVLDELLDMTHYGPRRTEEPKNPVPLPAGYVPPKSTTPPDLTADKAKIRGWYVVSSGSGGRI